MALFYLLLLILLVFGAVGAVVYFFTDMSQKIKYTILVTLVIGWGLIAIYSYYQNKKRLYIDKIFYEFNQGKELLCKDPFGEEVKVHKNYFNFVSGTLVFVGKENTKFDGLIVPLEKCKVLDEG